MGFVEIEQTPQPRKYNVDAIYRIAAKRGQGTLSFTRKGVEFLDANVKELDINKPFKVFIDSETLNLAFKHDENGKFHIRSSRSRQYTLSYSNINKQIGKPTHYLIELSKEYTFVLVPVKDAESSETQATQAPEAPKAEVEAAQTSETQAEAEKPSGKGKRKPKSK